MNRFKETFKKYKFINLSLLIFSSIILIMSIIIFPTQFGQPGHTGWDFNPFLLSSSLTIVGLFIIVFSANGTLIRQSKAKKIACFIILIIGLAVYVFGIVAQIGFSIDLLNLYNMFDWSPNVVTDTREHNVLSFYFIAPIFCSILFITIAIFYIIELIKQYKKQSTTTE